MAQRLLAPDGVRLVYREDPAPLDVLMPVSLSTHMDHHIDWRRLGLVVVEGMALP